MLRDSFLDGDARRTHGGLSWFGQKRALRPAGKRGLYFLAPGCSCRGYKQAREGVEPKSQREKGKRRLLEMLISCFRCSVGWLVDSSVRDVSSSSCPPLLRFAPACLFIGQEVAKSRGGLRRCFVDSCWVDCSDVASGWPAIPGYPDAVRDKRVK
jgi:hypothetical protein